MKQFVILGLLGAALAGCGETRSERTLTGGLIGAGTGALIGGAATGSAGGALVGGVVGGATGAFVGSEMGPDEACWARDYRGRRYRVSCY